MYKIKLQFLTNSGCEWLEEVVEVTQGTYKNTISEYYKSNEARSAALVNKWEANGEDECLSLDVENISAPRDFFDTIYNFVLSF